MMKSKSERGPQTSAVLCVWRCNIFSRLRRGRVGGRALNELARSWACRRRKWLRSGANIGKAVAGVFELQECARQLDWSGTRFRIYGNEWRD